MAMAQTGGRAGGSARWARNAASKLVYLMSVDSARFRRPVTPGDQVRLEFEKLQHRRNVWKFSGAAMVDWLSCAPRPSSPRWIMDD